MDFFPVAALEEDSDAPFSVRFPIPSFLIAPWFPFFNMPHAILEEANSHLANPQQLKAGEIVNIPRISHMVCQKTYSEMPIPMQQGQR